MCCVPQIAVAQHRLMLVFYKVICNCSSQLDIVCHMYAIDHTIPRILPGGYNIDFCTFLQKILKTIRNYEHTINHSGCY
jgi:hypothetical protein